MKRYTLFFIFFYFIFNIEGNASDKKKPLFDFTLDEQVESYKDDINLGKSNDIKNSEYWNTPLTKLDYILLQLKIKAEETEKKFTSYKYPIKDHFKRQLNPKKYRSISGKYTKHDVDSFVYYNEEQGKIVVQIAIDDLGVPKKPMKETCEYFLKYTMIGYPLPNNKIVGYNYHNSLLNELFRGGEYKDYSAELEKIANNLVYVLQLSSTKLVDELHESKIDTDTHVMSCWKLTGKDEFTFRKNSWSYRG